MHRNRLSVAAMLAVAAIGAHEHAIAPISPPADDRKPERAQRRIAGGNYIPFPNVKSKRTTVGGANTNLGRQDRRARRKVRMRLRKRRGWR